MSSIRSRILSIVAVPARGPLRIGRVGSQQGARLARQHDMVTEFQT